MTKNEDEAMKKSTGPWRFLAYALRYRTKEILAIIVVILLGVIVTMNISYSKKDGFQWRPAAKIEVKKGEASP